MPVFCLRPDRLPEDLHRPARDLIVIRWPMVAGGKYECESSHVSLLSGEPALGRAASRV